VFFDPDSDAPTPQYVDPAASMRAVADDMRAAGIDPAIVVTFERTGMLVTTGNRHLWSPADLREWEEAVASYRRAVVGY
jgi:hypothetical protein